MKIRINGTEKQLSSSETLHKIIEELCKENKRVIAEVNGEIIKSPNWQQTILKDGDCVELVSFVGGG